jgi:hypothetical protein
MPAHVEVIGYGRSASAICEECGIVRVHPRTAPAQDDARDHNRTAHPSATTEEPR